MPGIPLAEGGPSKNTNEGQPSAVRHTLWRKPGSRPISSAHLVHLRKVKLRIFSKSLTHSCLRFYYLQFTILRGIPIFKGANLQKHLFS